MTRGQSKSETLYSMDRIDERFPSGLKMKLQATESTVPPLDHLDCNTVGNYITGTREGSHRQTILYSDTDLGARGVMDQGTTANQPKNKDCHWNLRRPCERYSLL